MSGKLEEDTYNLRRFLEVQETFYLGYRYVLKRVRCGQGNEVRRQRLLEMVNNKNTTDYIGNLWLVFPRVEFDHDLFSNEYAIKSRGEAIAYLAHATLRKQIYTLCHALLAHDLDEESINDILGNYCDVERVKSTMTLFSEVSDERIFHDVLELYFNGEKCEVTLAKLNEWNKCMQKE